MTAKAQYIPNGYVCNKCGSRMDAIITPPLSTLGKIKLVCNNCNKHMTKTWQEEYDNIFGEKHYKICLGKNCECHKEVKQFISQAIDQTREETIKEMEWEIENWEIVDGKSFTSDKIKDILNKLKK